MWAVTDSCSFSLYPGLWGRGATAYMYTKTATAEDFSGFLQTLQKSLTSSQKSQNLSLISLCRKSHKVSSQSKRVWKVTKLATQRPERKAVRFPLGVSFFSPDVTTRLKRVTQNEPLRCFQGRIKCVNLEYQQESPDQLSPDHLTSWPAS